MATNNQDRLNRALAQLTRAGGSYRVVPNSTKLWVAYGTANDTQFNAAIAAINNAGQEVYVYTPHEDDDDGPD